MILLTVDEVTMLHEKLLVATGGLPGLRYRGLVESAVYSVDTAFEDVERYPSVEEKAARLTFALITDHHFVDGNRRVGVLALLMTRRVNQVPLRYTQEELIDLGLRTADGSIGYEEIPTWIMSHRITN